LPQPNKKYLEIPIPRDTKSFPIVGFNWTGANLTTKMIQKVNEGVIGIVPEILIHVLISTNQGMLQGE
jgi:hypothetical protein